MLRRSIAHFIRAAFAKLPRLVHACAMSDPKLPAAAAPPAWRTSLDFQSQAADQYQDSVLTPLFDLMAREPARVLELGCATGAFGAELKRRHPRASVVGIDAGHAAGARAAQRLDQVIVAQLDDFDFAGAGFKPGEFDTVIAADILEHLRNPWALLERLKPCVAKDAQLMVSIPNVRNATVGVQLLASGEWKYAERGLLDVTHLRFFTLASMREMFEQTGYVVEAQRPLMMPQLEPMYEGAVKKGLVALRFGRITIADVTPQEAMELCAQQFLLRVRPA